MNVHSETARWIADLSRPGALTVALNWYRANVAPESLFAEPQPYPTIAAPTLGIWSSNDAYLTEEQMARSEAHVTGSWRHERIERASHWLQLDAPERVNRLLVDFLGS